VAAVEAEVVAVVVVAADAVGPDVVVAAGDDALGTSKISNGIK
jgi:hypothetical protein